MSLIEVLQAALEKRVVGRGLRSLASYARELSKGYRNGGCSARSEALQLAYLVCRMPATFAAISRALVQAKERAPSLQVTSLLDLGAGPGTGLWAAADQFVELARAHLVEREPNWIECGKQLVDELPHAVRNRVQWERNCLSRFSSGDSYDLVLISYVLSEMPEHHWSTLLRKAWRCTNQLMVIVEPGTPRGFEGIRRVRGELVSMGAHLLAPCPHAACCPMQRGDWCHFAARLSRSRLHRLTKGGLLGYEDEKFSYLVASPIAPQGDRRRVVRSPQRRSGHILLTLCTQSGIVQEGVSRKTVPEYAALKDARWGDLI